MEVRLLEEFVLSLFLTPMSATLWWVPMSPTLRGPLRVRRPLLTMPSVDGLLNTINNDRAAVQRQSLRCQRAMPAASVKPRSQ